MKFLKFYFSIPNRFWMSRNSSPAELDNEPGSQYEFVRGAKWQFSRDKQIMLKLLEVNRVLMDKLEKSSQDKFVDEYFSEFRKLKSEVQASLS